jgi:acetylornithine/succinyldiaminopimelate/putrescine aminotransferase
MTLAKGLGYGVPIGAFLSKEYCMALVPGDHGSTFGGNALTTAAAFAGTKFLIDNQIPTYVKAMERHLMNRLNELESRFSFVSDVRGKGLLAAVEFESDISGQVLANANEAGILLNGVKPNAVRLMPPLTITAQEIDEGVGRLEQALGKI